MKRTLCICLAIALVISAFHGNWFAEDMNKTDMVPDFHNLDDPQLLKYVEDNVYETFIKSLDTNDYFVENVSSQYISKEYIEELTYNSKKNIYFGYTLDELEDEFQGKRFIFTLGEDGTTIVQEYEEYTNDFNKVLKNVAIGSGVILVCVTVSVVSGGTAPAVSMIFAASAKTGAIMAASSGVMGGVASGIMTGIQTNDFSQAIESGLLAGSEGFKWGAISGAIVGGVGEAAALHGATLNGLTMNEAATIQKDSGFPLDVIKEFRSMDQYNVCKEAGLIPARVDPKVISLIREIDLDSVVDEMGRTNAQRIAEGLSPLDPSGVAYELHHIGQQADSTLAILTKAEHMQNGNNKIWHIIGEETKVHGVGNTWDTERKAFWQMYIDFRRAGGI